MILNRETLILRRNTEVFGSRGTATVTPDCRPVETIPEFPAPRRYDSDSVARTKLRVSDSGRYSIVRRVEAEQ